MKSKRSRPGGRVLALAAVFLMAAACERLSAAEPDASALAGRWKLERERSTNIDPWREMIYDIQLKGSEITLVRTLRSGRYHQRDSMLINADDQERETPLAQGKWMEQVPVYNKALLDFCRSNSALAIDAQHHFEKDLTHLFSDLCHFTKEGHQEMAELIYRELSRHGYLAPIKP